MSTTANIAAKGTNGTGITEDLARTLHDQLGKTILAVVEIRSESRGENLKGDNTVKLAIQNIEVIPEDVGAAEHIREIAKVVHTNRKRAQDGPQLNFEGDGPEPTVAQVLAGGQQFRPHPYLASTLSTDDNAICDVCGQHADTVLHAERTGLDDPFAIPDDPEPDQTHAFVEGTIDGICAECEEPVDDDIHNVDDPGEPEGEADIDTCPAPGCELVAEHDGDHDHGDHDPDE